MEPSIIELKGAMYACELVKVKDSHAARLTIQMPSNDVDGNGNKIWLAYDVCVPVSEKKLPLFEELNKIYKQNVADFKENKESYNPVVKFIHIGQGQLKTDKKGNHYILANPNAISVIEDPEEKKFLNIATVNGEVENIITSDKGVRFDLKIGDAVDSTQNKMSIFLPKEVNEKKYNNVAKGLIEKGDKLSITGTIFSNTFNAEGESKRVCRILTDKYRLVEKKKKLRNQPNV